MQKKFYMFYVFAISTLLIFNFLIASNNSIFAQEPYVENVATTLHFFENDLEVPKENNIYQIYFENNLETPYQTYTIKTAITMNDASSPTQELINEISWTIANDTTQTAENLVFNNNQYQNEYYIASLNGANLNLTPLLPCTLEITCLLQSNESKITACCNYATPERVNIYSDQNLTQLYEDFEDLQLNAIFDYSDFINPNINYRYIWTIGTNTMPDKTSVLIVTKDMIKIGENSITVQIEGDQKLSATVKLVITTNQPYKLNVTYSGNLTQTYDENNQPITFTASLPITQTYTITWYQKFPNNNIYQQLNLSDNSTYTFYPLQNSTGAYKVFAQATIGTQIVTSEIFNIIINPKAATISKQFTIIASPYSNLSTNVQAFDCSIDTQNYYEDDQIVWLVNGTMYAQGSHIKFEPSLAGEYIIQVKLINPDNTLGNSISKTVTLNAKTIEQNTIYIYVTIGIIALLGICISSIIISNKIREKIW